MVSSSRFTSEILPPADLSAGLPVPHRLRRIFLRRPAVSLCPVPAVSSPRNSPCGPAGVCRRRPGGAPVRLWPGALPSAPECGFRISDAHLFLNNARPAGPEPTQDSGPAFYVLDDEKNSFFSHFHLMEGRYTGSKRRDFYGKGIGPL